MRVFSLLGCRVWDFGPCRVVVQCSLQLGHFRKVEKAGTRARESGIPPPLMCSTLGCSC